MSGPDWTVERHRGSAHDFHARAVPAHPSRSVWVHEVARPALVLGSAQPDSVVDLQAVASVPGMEVVRRRSGGGAVLLVPGEVLWVDVVIGRGDPLWHDDVGRSMWWVGERFASVLGAGARVHHGGLVSSRWSRLVCFAGLGPGEVTLDGRKLVGISQRRTRDSARFQCALYRRWDVDALLAVLHVDAVERAAAHHDLVDAVATSAVVVDDVVAALTAA